MARVVQQRRSKPPYLLIVFVFLFLVAATMAVVFYMQKSRAEEEKARLEQDDKELRAEKAKEADARRQLVYDITGDSNQSAAMAHQKVTSAWEALKRAEGIAEEPLADAVDTLLDLWKQARAESEEMRRQRDAWQSKCQNVENAFDQTRRQLEADRDKLSEDLATCRQEKNAAQQDFDRRVREAQQSFQDGLAELQTELSKRAREIQDLESTVSSQELTIIRLQGIINRVTRPKEPGLTIEPDGHILGDVQHEQEVCTISIGRKHGVRGHLRFSVFAPGNLPERAGGEEQAKRKGRIEVIGVRKYVSQCQILWEDPEDPIRDNDLIVNLAFASGRPLIFRVVGEFDMRGLGRPSAAGGEQVEAMIRRAGGRVTDTVDYQTSYVVVGKRPNVPKQPAEDADLTVWQVYREQQKAVQAYDEALTRADQMKVEKLTLDKLVNLLGELRP